MTGDMSKREYPTLPRWRVKLRSLQHEKIKTIIYFGPALGSRLEHGRLDCGTYVVIRLGYIFGTNVIENIDYVYV